MANTAWYLYNHRLSLARALRESGREVVLVSPGDEYAARLSDDGFDWIEVPMDRKGTNPITDIMTLARMVGVYRQVRPELVHHFTLKPVAYGSLAAALQRVPAIVNSITGLGYLFTGQDGSLGRKRLVAKPLIRVALKAGSQRRVVFQNRANLEYYVAQRLVDVQEARIVHGSGVDADRFRPEPEPAEPVVVLLAGRMLWDKGVSELVEAGGMLRSRGVSMRIVLVGAPDPGNPSSVSAAQLQAWEQAGAVEWWGHQDDMRQAFRRCHIVALPSYAEGIPRALLEAAAMGKPLVASDIPGCREVVIDRVNGMLVPVGDAQALAEALRTLIADRELREAMGREGRKLVLERFTDEIIVRETMQIYEELIDRDRRRMQ